MIRGAKKKAKEAQEDANKFFSEKKINIQYPEKMDDNLKGKMNEVFSVVSLIDENNIDDIVATLKEVKKNIGEMEGQNKYTMMAQTAIAVGIASTQTWHKATYDKKDPLHYLMEDGMSESEDSGQDDTCITLWIPGRTAIVIIGDIMGVMMWPSNFLDCLQVSYNSDSGPYWFSSLFSVAQPLIYAAFSPTLYSLRAAADDSICIQDNHKKESSGYLF